MGRRITRIAPHVSKDPGWGLTRGANFVTLLAVWPAGRANEGLATGVGGARGGTAARPRGEGGSYLARTGSTPVPSPAPRRHTHGLRAVRSTSATPRTAHTDARPPVISSLPDDELLTSVYLETVRRPGVTRAQLLGHGYRSEDVDSAIGALVHLGLLRRSGESSWEALPPDICLPALAGQYELRAATMRSLATELARTYRTARTRSSADSGITFLSTLQELQDASEQVMALAEQEVIAIRDDSPRTAYLFALEGATLKERWLGPDGRPLRVRTTYDTAVFDLPHATDILQTRAESGEECRFLRGLPFSVIVADTAAAVVDLTSFDSSGQGCLLVHDRRLVLALAALVDMTWQMATPLSAEPADDGEPDALDPQARLIIGLLAAGTTDATIAARMGVSQRTIERKVRVLMNRLGAVTRFEAGVQAARRGWL